MLSCVHGHYRHIMASWYQTRTSLSMILALLTHVFSSCTQYHGKETRNQKLIKLLDIPPVFLECCESWDQATMTVDKKDQIIFLYVKRLEYKRYPNTCDNSCDKNWHRRIHRIFSLSVTVVPLSLCYQNIIWYKYLSLVVIGVNNS